MMVDFAKSSETEYWIMNIENIQHSIAKPENLDRFFVKKLVYRDPEYTKKHLSHIIKAAKSETTLQDPKIKKRIKQLDTIYENMKDEINLKLDFRDVKDTRPDDSFKKIHPDFDINLTDIVEGYVKKKEVINAMKKLYYKDYRKKGALDKIPKREKTLKEKEIEKYNEFKNRFSRSWHMNNVENGAKWNHKMKPSVVLPSLKEIQYESPFLYDLGDVDLFDDRRKALKRYRS